MANSDRRQIMDLLREQPLTTGDIDQQIKWLDRCTIMQHLRVLERAGLLSQTREGQVRRCRLLAEPLREAATWVEQYRQFWETQLDSLADYLEETSDNNEE